MAAAEKPLSDTDFENVLETGVGWEKIIALSDRQVRKLSRFKGVTIDEGFVHSFEASVTNSASDEIQAVSRKLEPLRGSRGVLPLFALENISGRQARELSAFYGHTILLWSVKSLNLGQATALAQFHGDWNYAALDLRGLESLSRQSAEALAQFRGDLLNLNGLLRIEDSVATALSKAQCKELDLNGLQRLTLKQASALGAFGGERIKLNGLRDLTTLQARALAGFAGEEMSLPGITLTDDVVIAELASFDGLMLDLSGLRYLSDGQAKTLATFGGAELNLSGLLTLSDLQARELGEAKCRKLRLDGLTRISETQAASLAKFAGKTLSLGAWDQFDIQQIENFAGDNLYLTGLTEMTQQTVNSVLRCQARMVWLNADVVVSDKNFALLAETDSVGLVLSNVESLKRVPLQLLMTWSGGLQFNSVTELDERFLPALATWKGSALHLDGVVELQAGQAQALSAFHCAELSVSGLRALTDSDVERLIEYTGRPLDVSGWSDESRRLYFQKQFAQRK